MDMLRIRSRYAGTLALSNEKLRSVMSGNGSNENDPENVLGTASTWPQHVTAIETTIDGDLPDLEMLQIYITASVFLCAWLGLALFFA